MRWLLLLTVFVGASSPPPTIPRGQSATCADAACSPDYQARYLVPTLAAVFLLSRRFGSRPA
jgi:hypothetical protein